MWSTQKRTGYAALYTWMLRLSRTISPWRLLKTVLNPRFKQDRLVLISLRQGDHLGLFVINLQLRSLRCALLQDRVGECNNKLQLLEQVQSVRWRLCFEKHKQTTPTLHKAPRRFPWMLVPHDNEEVLRLVVELLQGSDSSAAGLLRNDPLKFNRRLSCPSHL